MMEFTNVRNLRKCPLLALALVGFAAHAKPNPLSAFEDWLTLQNVRSAALMNANISRPDTLPGTVVASPSKRDPDYYFHWTRDAALVMDVYMDWGLKHQNTLPESAIVKAMHDYATLSMRHQARTDAFGGLGEPKYLVSGAPYTGPWGRPQNDGPALRALTLMRFADKLITDGEGKFVQENFYDSKLPSHSAIKADLEYVASQWKVRDFDLWEEVRGFHFFTRLAQRRALLKGSDFARKMGDAGAADWYLIQARGMEREIVQHWDASKGYINATLSRDGGIDYKSGLDASVILAALYMHQDGDNFYALTNPQIQATAEKLISTFAGLYTINRKFPALGTAIGRYPEDRYNGYDTSSPAHPWFLLTSAMAEYCYRLAKIYATSGAIQVKPQGAGFLRWAAGLSNQELQNASATISSDNELFKRIVSGLVQKGDGFMERVWSHTASDGSMSEQFSRDNGFMQGAHNLTWSHSNFLRAYWARQALAP